jgi:hypothetical protein
MYLFNDSSVPRVSCVRDPRTKPYPLFKPFLDWCIVRSCSCLSALHVLCPMFASSRRSSYCSKVLKIKSIKEQEWKNIRVVFVRERQVVFSPYIFYFILYNCMTIKFIFYDIA